MADSADGARRGDPVALRCGYERLREAVLSGRADGWRLGHGVLATRGTVAWVAAVGEVAPKQVEDVLAATLESTPENATHWSRAKMADRSGLSESTIGRIWRAFGLQPHRTETFKLCTDPLFVEKVYDVVGLYLNPPEAAVVLCVDEKSQVQALARSQPAFPMMPEQRTHDYLRQGTTSLFAAFNTADGTVISATHRRHSAVEFRKFLQKIDSQVPEHLDVHLVCDNYGTHKSPAIVRWLEQHPRLQMHYTPTYSSWINQ